MEKKRTKIAYFTAVGVFLVLLVVLGLTYRETPLPTLEVEGEPVLAHTLRAIDVRHAGGWDHTGYTDGVSGGDGGAVPEM